MRRALCGWTCLAALISVDIYAQQRPAPRPSNDRVAALEQRVTELEKLVKSQGSWIPHFLGRLPTRTAFLDCATSKYVEAAPTNGYLVFLVSCASVEPYLEGFKLTLKIGNPHASDFSQVAGTVGYGETPNHTLEQRVPFNVLGDLAAGRWTETTVVIPRAAAKDLREVAIEFAVESAALNRR